MTDRELMEMAARAAGYVPFQWDNCEQCWRVRDDKEGREFWFGPLDDDGDAFRLMTKLELEPYFGIFGVTIRGTSEDFAPEYYKVQDKNAAARRVIVRAAAKIGGMMV